MHLAYQYRRGLHFFENVFREIHYILKIEFIIISLFIQKPKNRSNTGL